MITQDIWTIYNKEVKQFIRSKVKDEQVANDLLQETFINTHTKIDTLKDQEKLKSWVFSIARYTVLDYFREHKPSREYFDGESVLEEEKSGHNEKDCLRGILKSLPKKYRDPLFLSDIKG